MNIPSGPALAALLDALLARLPPPPERLTEFELLRRLEDDGVPPFDALELGEPLALYRAHFLLFHCLYLLQDRLRAAGEELEVHCLRIARHTGFAPSEAQAVAMPDPLRAYYLDPANLDSVGAEDVVRMLAQFWRRFRANSARVEALAVLELPAGASADEIRRQYRRLVMQHHPDRGGDKAKLQALNAAMAALDDA